MTNFCDKVLRNAIALVSQRVFNQQDDLLLSPSQML